MILAFHRSRDEIYDSTAAATMAATTTGSRVTAIAAV